MGAGNVIYRKNFKSTTEGINLAGLYANRANKLNPFITLNDLVDAVTALDARKKPIELEEGPIVSWDYDEGYNTYVTLEGNRTLSLTNVEKGDYGTIKVIQDSVGGRTLTLPAGSKVGNDSAGVLPLTSTPDAYDIATFYCDENGTLNFTFTNNFT